MAESELPPCPLWAKIIATGGGVGYIPFAPGTFGSLAALLLYYVIENIHFEFSIWSTGRNSGLIKYFYSCFPNFPIGWVVFFSASFFLVVGIPASSQYARSISVKDPSRVVVDEIAGQLITILGFWGTAPGFLGLYFAFILFRLLDIWKPWPIRRFEKLPGGWGIMADDVVAGIIGAVILAILVHFHILSCT